MAVTQLLPCVTLITNSNSVLLLREISSMLQKDGLVRVILKKAIKRVSFLTKISLG